MKNARFLVLLVLFCVACSSTESADKPATPGAVGTVRAAISTSDYRSLVLGDGAVGYWRLGDTGTTTALNSVPGGIPGLYTNTVSGSPYPNQGEPGALLGDSDPAAEFFIYNNPGTTQSYVLIQPDSSQAPTTHQLMVEAWFTMTPGRTPQSYAAIVSKTTGGVTDGYGIYWNQGRLYFYLNNRNINVSVPASAMGDTSRFHHVVGTYDGNAINIYYDGVPGNPRPLSAAEGQGQNVNAPGGPLQIGKSPWSSVGWQGRIDEVAIYPTALDAGHIQSHFQAGRPPGPLSRAFVAYAQQSLTFGTGDQITGGDVGVASMSSQSTVSQLVIGDSDVFDTQRGVFAPSVSMGSQAQVGSVFTNAPSGSTIASQPFPTSMPLLPLVPAGISGTMNITVAAGKTLMLPPGSYGALTVNGTLRLSPAGAYTFSSVNVGAGGIIYGLYIGMNTIRVDGTLTTGAGAVIANVDTIAGALSISVAGQDSGSGSPAVSLGANTQLQAVLSAPRGTISIGDGSYVSGAVSAFAINVGNNVTMKLDAPTTATGDAQTGQQKLSGYITPQIANAPLVGPVPPSTQLSLSISLPVQVPPPSENFPALSDFAEQVSDPSNARYRQYLSPADYARHYAPTTDAYNQLSSFVTSCGLTIVTSYDDHELIDVTGTAAQIARMLYANLNLYQRDDGSTFYSLDREPSLDLSVPILHISGANNFHVSSSSAGPGSFDGNLFGNDFRNAYVPGCTSGAQSLDGSGQSITILMEHGFNPEDIKAYCANAGIPNPNIRGAIFSPGDPLSIIIDALTEEFPGSQIESPMDVELAHAMAPAAGIILYIAPGSSSFVHDYGSDLMHAAAHPPYGLDLSKQVSSSWNFEDDDSTRQSIDAMAAQGQSYLQAAGDYGSSTGNPLDPRLYNNVTLVGGTTLLSFTTGTGPAETTWVGAGAGGYMGPFNLACGPDGRRTSCGSGQGIGRPKYQSRLPNTGFISQKWRNFPDISMPATNVEVFETINGSRLVKPEGGTSASAPLFAGYMALVNQQAAKNRVPSVGFVNPALYAIGANTTLANTCFNDVLVGQIPSLPGSIDTGFIASGDPVPQGGFPATAGYDLATGWGSPTCTLLNQLASWAPTIPVSSVLPPLSPVPSDVGLGTSDSCVIIGGATNCWGVNFRGANGTGTNGNVNNEEHLAPVCATISAPPARAIACGDGFCCAIMSDATVGCWGANSFGQLGLDAIDGATGQPRPMDTVQTIEDLPVSDPPVQLAAGGSTVCAVLTSGALRCWGDNSVGQLGRGVPTSGPNPDPSAVEGIADARQVSIDPFGKYVCALRFDGSVYCWGSGRLGSDVPGGQSASPVGVQLDFLIGLMKNAVSISLGPNHACALISGSPNNDGLWCWGDNSEAQLGTGSTSPQSSKVATPATTAPSQLREVACGSSSTCVLSLEGTVFCWGDNELGQLGNGAQGTSDAPQLTASQVPSVGGAFAIYAGGGRTCVQMSGGVTCWGQGPIGNNTTGVVPRPTSVPLIQCL
jgi:alpha-tubulin suppressor-like RCC1 family protein